MAKVSAVINLWGYTTFHALTHHHPEDATLVFVSLFWIAFQSTGETEVFSGTNIFQHATNILSSFSQMLLRKLKKIME